MPSGFADALVFIRNLASPPASTRNNSRRGRRTRLRRPIKISSPIAHESFQSSLNVNAAAAMSNSIPRPESGVFYLVPSKTGPGKAIVRRPAPPPSTVPLDDGFDIATHGANTTSKAATTANGSRKRPHLNIRTAPSASEGRTVSPPRTVTPKPGRLNPMQAIRNSFRAKSRDPGASASNGHSRQWKGKEKAVDDVGDDPSDNRIASKAREIRAWMMGKSGSDIHRVATHPLREQQKTVSSPANVTRTRNTTGGVKGLFKSQRTDSTTGDRSRGPRPGQKYEMVNRRIIENNQEKTVEISTWREQSGRVVKPEDADRISVYYISADEYAQEVEDNVKVEWRYDDGDGPTTSNSGPVLLDKPESHTSTKVKKEDIPSSPPRNPRENKRGLSSSSRRDGTISPSTSEKDGSSETGKPNGLGEPMNESTPPKRRPSSAARGRHRYKATSPTRKGTPRSPFHATRSGSTISSIKSETTIQFEAVLESCEPSILHIAPVLRTLGIRRVDHLKAIARLTPTTRDREVKEDALRLGMTVMEWAIFVDRIFTL